MKLFISDKSSLEVEQKLLAILTSIGYHRDQLQVPVDDYRQNIYSLDIDVNQVEL